MVLESDDWGSTGAPSVEARERLRKSGVFPDDDALHYYLYDGLECNADLEELFRVLEARRDSRDRPAVMTAFCLVANPDFGRIREDEFRNYYPERMDRTIAGDTDRDRVCELWKEGRDRGVFVPQFHGREHLNVAAWMQALQNGAPLTRKAFDEGVYGFDPVSAGESSVAFRAAFDLQSAEEIKDQAGIIAEGCRMFRELTDRDPEVFVPSNGPFNLALEPALLKAGIRYLVLDKLQREPLGGGLTRRRLRYPGKRNLLGQVYLGRNAAFEPSMEGHDWEESCLSQVAMAFRWHKPAVISTHRVNYCGYLDPVNRERGLAALDRLLKKVTERWPEVEFLSTAELGKLMEGKG